MLIDIVLLCDDMKTEKVINQVNIGLGADKYGEAADTRTALSRVRVAVKSTAAKHLGWKYGDWKWMETNNIFGGYLRNNTTLECLVVR